MSTFEVKLRTVYVGPHPNADKLDLVTADGFTVVSQKGLYESGEELVYIPENAILPDSIQERLGLTGMLKDGRLRAIRLRGIISQGMVMRPTYEELEEILVFANSTGAPFDAIDLAEFYGIKKWEPPIPANMSGKVVPFPDIPSYTEIENVKKFPDVLIPGEKVVVTEKIHGTCTIMHFQDGQLYVSSKGQAKKGLVIVEDDANVYWQVAKRYEIAARLALAIDPTVIKSITLFGETFGKVQNLKYGIDGGVDFRLFDIMVNKEYVPWATFSDYANRLTIPTVPTIYVGPYYPGYLQDMPSGNELVSGKQLHIREGVVVKPANERRDPVAGRVIFKYINDDYLADKNRTEYE